LKAAEVAAKAAKNAELLRKIKTEWKRRGEANKQNEIQEDINEKL
jgi:hypothetical protein